MHHWSFYFLAKLGLFYAGRMNFHWPANLLLALCLLWPLAPGRVRTVRAWVAWPLALSLLYYDSYLPAIGRVLSQVTALAQFRLDYLAELVQRAVEVRTLVAALALVAVYLLLARRIRFATVVFFGDFQRACGRTVERCPCACHHCLGAGRWANPGANPRCAVASLLCQPSPAPAHPGLPGCPAF